MLNRIHILDFGLCNIVRIWMDLQVVYDGWHEIHDLDSSGRIFQKETCKWSSIFQKIMKNEFCGTNQDY